MAIQDAYNNWSTTYDSDLNLTRDLDHIATEESLNTFKCKTILELGCGTGKNTQFLSAIADDVIAVDFSEGMLAIAKEKSADLNNVLFSLADITKPWPFDAQTFDLIACNLVLEHIEDLSFIFSEAKRVLRTGGSFFICELHPFRQYQGKKARFERDNETIHIQAFVHNISDFFAAAKNAALTLSDLREWYHEEDQNKPPRLVSFIFKYL